MRMFHILLQISVADVAHVGIFLRFPQDRDHRSRLQKHCTVADVALPLWGDVGFLSYETVDFSTKSFALRRETAKIPRRIMKRTL
jgi:hypothetical protein